MMKLILLVVLIANVKCRVLPFLTERSVEPAVPLTGTPKGVCRGPEDDGKYFVYVCNSCICSPEPGEAACSRVGCPPIYGTAAEVCHGQKDIGLDFKNDCNSCFCSAHPGVAGCTLMACPEKSKEIVEIPPKM